MNATAAGPSVQSTRARSIVTLDGYVSRGRSPPSSVPRDHAMLQEFALYLELRLKCLNMSMLRRIFADFLNEQENTLVPMMQMGFTIVTIYPVLRTSPERLEKAKVLLQKPKSHLDSRGCIFLYLQYRTATRNMVLFKQLFLEFVEHRETSLLAFVQRGFEVISVIPFELQQLAVPMIPQPPQVQQESPRTVESVQGQRQEVEGSPAETTKEKSTETAPKKPVTPTASSSASVASPGGNKSPAEKRLRRRSKRVSTRNSGSVTTQAPGAPNESAVPPTRRRSLHKAVSSDAPATNEANETNDLAASSPAVVTITRRRRKPKSTAQPRQEAASTEEAVEFGPAEAPKPAAQPPKRKRGRPRKSSEMTQAKLKRGKPMLSEAMLHCQLELTRKVQAFEEQIPWEAVYSNLPAPFDESKHTDLSFMYRSFWRKYARAVWERNFWSAMSRKLNPKDFNERSARQYAAKVAFESLIVAVYRELGAQFFVKLDAERHPGWWYRGFVVSLYSLQQIKGERAMWKYVKEDAQAFPGLPAAASFGGVKRCGYACSTCTKERFDVDGQP
ncbi:hypothetical protein P3T76_007472 [Phytophthora citrophthora]|uniref:Uncharacterized protein n=1 Tax=Phytophthora citrophthora TaxID=4793 RepID=A0AAD9GLS3_9STRA|nr:hypothetical protein P3T76_007472 [Phytophthora citrophthora]